MAKNIIMQVLTSTGYEPMYPFNPRQTLNGTFLTSSTSSQYKITITGVTIPLTNSFGNDMGIISFVPTVNNAANVTLSVNSDTARPIKYADGTNVRANALRSGRNILLKFYNNNFYLLMDKYQLGLENVDNTADTAKPISTATQTALNNKLNIPTLIPSSANLNNYRTAGLYYNTANSQVATMTNVPAKQAFSLLVERHAGVKQTFTTYQTGSVQTWVRNYFNGTWGSWRQQAFVLWGTSEPNNTTGLDGNIYLKINN